MAIFIHNNLIATSDFLKITRRYSSLQSIARAKKKGFLKLVSIGKMQFAPATPDDVARFYNIPSWEGLPVVSPETPIAGLTILSRIQKTIGRGEGEIVGWALFNHIDVIWIAGNLFADLGAVQRCAAKMKASEVPTVQKNKKRRRILD